MMNIDVTTRPGRGILLLGLVAGLVAPCGPANVHAAEVPGIERASFLKGCWRFTRGERAVEEQWMAPSGGTMLGMSRTVTRGNTTEYEFVILRAKGAQIEYAVQPSGQAAVAFTSIVVEPEKVVFENKANDFPQRIGYERREGRLLAWIEGDQNGKVRRIEFPYEAAACPSV